MNSTRKALATAGFVALSVFAVTPAIAAADTPQMYQNCSADQVGRRITTDTGGTLECVGVDTGTGYNWAEPGAVD